MIACTANQDINTRESTATPPPSSHESIQRALPELTLHNAQATRGAPDRRDPAKQGCTSSYP